MRTVWRGECIGTAALIVGAVLVLRAVAQEAAEPAEQPPEQDQFVLLGKAGEGMYHSYADIPFRFADVPIQTQLLIVGHMFGIGLPRDELALGGQVAQRVHLMALTAYSLETPHGVNVATIHVVYDDGTRETQELVQGVHVAEWSYANPAYGRRLAHDRVAPAYDWLEQDPEAGGYPGYAFYVVLETQQRPIDRLELHLNEEALIATPGGNFVLMVNAVTLELAQEAGGQEGDAATAAEVGFRE